MRYTLVIYFLLVSLLGTVLVQGCRPMSKVGNSRSNYTQVSIVPRSVWNAKSTKSSTLLPLPVQYVFIHHTYIPGRCYSSADCEKAVLGMQRYHQNNRGWDDIGYSFLFGDDGNIYEGRGWDRVGAHTRHYNSVGLGFCFIGDFTRQLPSQVMLDNALAMMAEGVRLGKIRPNYVIRGHRDMKSNTECPGDRLYQLIKTWPNYT